MVDGSTAAASPAGAEARMARLFDRTLGAVLSLLVFIMMGLTFVDVFGRLAFNSPLPGGYEITQMAVGLVVYLGLPVVSARREHITIGLIEHLFPRGFRRVQHAVINLVLGLMTVAWGREVWTQAATLDVRNELFMNLQIKVAPVVYVMGGLTFLAAAAFLVLAWCHLRGADAPSAATGPG
jgi:TRAP-type C4-dicarboxylate transport system permease small subunit